jgi:hypothetical protein
MACEDLQQQVNDLQKKIADLQRDLRGSSGHEKWDILAQISELLEALKPAQKALAECRGIKPPVECTSSGTATLTTTNDSAPGPYTVNLSMKLRFDASRNQVTITYFPEFRTEPFDTPFGTNVTTVSKTGGGTGTFDNGQMTVPLTLHFDHSADIIFYDEDSDLSITLSTAAPGGSPIGPDGRFSIVGTGTFKGGFLGGSSCTIVMTGTVSPVP